ncbi:MAG: ABC transporter substrate-binding protein [Nocardiopsaceae bacterium]|jgi:NitT/TauT family transport system substrate-binding protein|nr:ABC transporter substrate-binding protein [Nocardiopsaceae bacterium]
MRQSCARIGVPIPRTSARRLRPIAALLACLSAAAGISGCNPFSPNGKPVDATVVRVGVVPGIDNATLKLAVKRGYFSDAGLNVEIAKFKTVDDELQALSNGHVDVAAADYGNLFAKQSALQKTAFKILADGYDAAPGVVQIMTMPNSPVQSPDQLTQIGAPNIDQVGAPTGGPNSLVIASATSVLQSYGVNLSNLTWKNMSETEEINQLVSGQIKAALLTQPYVFQAQQKGAIMLVDACSGATEGIPLSGYFASTSWANHNSKEVAAFRTGLARADAEASMPGPVQAILPKYAGLSPQEAALITTGDYPLSTITANLQRTADLMNRVGMIPKQLNVAAMIAK